MTSRAFIAGCLGTSLTPDERAFFRDARPWGFILFKRNTQTPGAGRGADGGDARDASAGTRRS